MKERILTALKAKFSGVSADILDRIAAMLAKTVTTEEQVATAVEGVTEELINVIEGYGDSRATGAQKTAVANYERKYGLKDGAKVVKEDIKPDTKPTPEGGGDQTPAWAQALIDSNKQLTKRLNKMEGERITNSRKAELEGIINRLPEKGKLRLSDPTAQVEHQFYFVNTQFVQQLWFASVRFLPCCYNLGNPKKYVNHAP